MATKRGFALLSPERQRELASMGGKAAHASGRARKWTPRQARVAGASGGKAAHTSGAANRWSHDAAVVAGQKGGQATQRAYRERQARRAQERAEQDAELPVINFTPGLTPRPEGEKTEYITGIIGWPPPRYIADAHLGGDPRLKTGSTDKRVESREEWITLFLYGGLSVELERSYGAVRVAWAGERTWGALVVRGRYPDGIPGATHAVEGGVDVYTLPGSDPSPVVFLLGHGAMRGLALTRR